MRFTEALSDPSSGLTRKQSVVDAECLFSPKQGYDYEARYITTIWNWRRASDERGLSSLQRCKYNYQFLQMILAHI